jgi:hypothetical protein
MLNSVVVANVVVLVAAVVLTEVIADIIALVCAMIALLALVAQHDFARMKDYPSFVALTPLVTYTTSVLLMVTTNQNTPGWWIALIVFVGWIAWTVAFPFQCKLPLQSGLVTLLSVANAFAITGAYINWCVAGRYYQVSDWQGIRLPETITFDVNWWIWFLASVLVLVFCSGFLRIYVRDNAEFLTQDPSSRKTDSA